MTLPLDQFCAAHARQIARLHKSALDYLSLLRGQLSEAQLAAALHRSAKSRFADSQPAASDIAKYLDTLNIGDLALACACAAGSEPAWDHFMAQYRPDLYAAARAVAGESNHPELADSLYAELYGLQERDGQRRSLFDYFHGRSKLSTWLRAILAQRHVDAIRASRRSVSLDDEAAGEPQTAATLGHAAAASSAPSPESDADRSRYLDLLQSVLESVLAALAPRDRLRLSYYYVQDLTLAQIGRLTGEHEATVSRKLDRTRRELREAVDTALRHEKRLSAAQIALCYDYARQEWPFDLTKVLAAEEKT